MPVPFCFDYDSFIGQSEVREPDFSSCFSFSRLLWLFRIFCVSVQILRFSFCSRSAKNASGNLKEIPLNLQIALGQPIEWEKIFANNMANKRLSSKIYKQLMQLNIKKSK